MSHEEIPTLNEKGVGQKIDVDDAVYKTLRTGRAPVAGTRSGKKAFGGIVSRGLGAKLPDLLRRVFEEALGYASGTEYLQRHEITALRDAQHLRSRPGETLDRNRGDGSLDLPRLCAGEVHSLQTTGAPLWLGCFNY
ncbi:unnamed protein product [Durusdinium trenchii]|uniref:Histone H4 n=1 Tax=Durusdinium trenchii TaxID=1381693 RepID=A0ABP0LP35_9DINO